MISSIGELLLKKNGKAVRRYRLGKMIANLKK